MTDEPKEALEQKNLPANVVNEDEWQEAQVKPTEINCNSVYDSIVSAMVDYDPADRYNIFAVSKSTGRPLNINPDMSLRINKGPELIPPIQKHVAGCDFCQRLIEQLAGLKLARGQLAIESNLSQKSSAFMSNPRLKKMMIESGWKPKRDKFKGTPTQIVEGMVRDASQFMKSKDQAEFMTRKAKFIKHILGIIKYKPDQDPDGSISITDTEFIQAMVLKGAATIIADPWFVLAPRPPDIRMLSGEE
jgi:hypothetical protein